MNPWTLALLMLFSTDGLAPQTRAKQPYPYVESAKVVGYAFNLSSSKPECLMPVNPDGSLCKSLDGTGKTLNAAQAQKLRTLLRSKSTFGGDPAKCFIPHHAFIFHDAKGKVVGQISICFMCNRLRGSPKVKAKARRNGRTGISRRGMKALRKLCNDLGLKACFKRRP